MRIRVTRFVCVVAVVFIATLAAQPAWATLPTPNQPVLVVQDNTSTNPYQNFVPELLTTEGLNGFQVAQLGDLTAAFLTNYDVVILPHLTLTAGQSALFQNYVNAGGTLIGFRPDLQLASVFGVASLGTTLPEAWLKIDTTTPYATALVSNVMKFHGTADLYSLNGASALATLYNTATISTTSPAAAINSFGLGKAILFSFDLTQSIVLMRQGNPAWAGYPNNHDGFNTMRASQMFMDQPSGQFWNDLGDGALSDVPQADIQLRLFSNALTLTNAAKRPLPKLWYFPNQNRAQLLMTGDDHSFPVADALSEINNIATFGGLFSYNLWYPFSSVSNSQVNTWLAAGNTMVIHFDDTTESDSSGVGGSKASWNGMQNVISGALASFAATYPSAPFPVTTRNHFLIWVSNDADGTADQVAQAKLFQNNGIQLDTSYSSFPNRWGYMTGSGLPMKFLDPVAGKVVPVYEQATQYEDDVQLLTNSYSMEWSQATAQSHYQQSLSDSLTKYNTVITMLWHPENWASYGNYVQSTLQYAKAQSIPISTTGKWLTFWQARAATTMSMPSFTSNTLTFTATGSPAGLTLLVPEASGNNKVVSTFQVDGVSQSFTVAAYQGVMDAGVVLTAGTHNISVTYTPAGRISGQITPSPAVASTTVQVQGGSITQSVSVAADGTYAVGPLPAGTYAVTPASLSYTFSPSSKSVTLGTADVTGVNFTATVNTAGQTLFTTQTPATTNASDGTNVNYELGTAFTSTATGQITAVRFWKAPSESGTHTGRIWSSTGTLLASVAFVNETASGWQQQALTTPLSIAANTTYVVSANTGSSFYVATSGGLATQVVNGNLRSVVGNNGVYGSPGTFPTNGSQTSNYFRDIVFSPGTAYSLSGSVTPSSSAAGTTLTLTLSGSVIATAAADSSGAYTFTGVFGGNYTVTPSKAGFTFSPTSAPVTVNNGNVTVTTFTVTPIPTYSVSGTITPAASSTGTTVTLSGAANATTTADSSGNYGFTGLLNGSYTVTPTKAGFTFSSTSAPATVNGGNVTVTTFTATTVPTYTVSGTITPSANGTRSSVTLTLSGSTIASVAADSSGNYSFTGLNAGSYTVTPTKSGFTFSPTSAPATVTNANVTVATFTATANSVTQTLFTTQTPAITNASDGASVNYELGTALTSTAAGQIIAVRFWKAPSETGTHTGRIWSSTGTLLGSVIFTGETASGWQQQTLTTPISVAANTTYVVSVNTGNTFYVATTSGLATQVVNANLKSVVGNNGVYGSTGTFPTNSFQTTNYFRDVVFVPGATYTVSGSVTPAASGTGTTLTLSGAANATTTADSSGNYAFTGLLNGSYTVTPTKTGFTFSPTSAPVTVNNGNVTVTTFTTTPIPTYTVSGTITPSANGSGTTVTLSGAANATTTADSSGNYAFSGLLNGSYTVTPTKTGFTFSPTSAPATVNDGNVTVTTFTATPIPTYSVSGTITPAASGTGTTVTLSGAANSTTTADGSGNYSFTGLNAGSYTVTPAKSGFTFSPTSAPANVTNANVTVTTFTATAVPTYTVSGTITPSANGSGTTVTLSGAANATATADGSGNYSFTGLNAGSYTVTPTKSGFTFSPTSAPATVTNANVTVATFTATANSVTQTLFTTQTPAITNASDGASVNYELGTALTSTAAGQIIAVRFWKAPSETGTHTGRIWSSTGTLLGSVIFTGETASGWQQQTLTTPISVAANTTYVVSVNTGNTFYVATTSGLATQVVNANLKSVVGNNGVYGSTGTFPTNSFQTTNYFRDVVFVPGATYTVSGSVTPAASGTGTTLTLSGAANATTTADSSGNYAFTGLLNGSYTVTPTKTGFAFSPTSAPATVNGGNVTVTTFTATAVPTFTVSGTITPAASGTGSTVTLTLSGTTVATVTANSTGAYTFTGVAAGSYTVTPTKAGFTFSPTSTPANVTNANVTVTTFTAAAGAQSLFTTQTPATTNNSDGAGINYELGILISSNISGQITAVRFWKASSETGTHTGRVWSSTGTLLGSVVFTGETASGWQQQTLTTPISITAGTTYVVSVNTGSTFYVATNSGLAAQVVNGNLSSVVGNNGLYGATGTFPTNSFQASNYFRDVVFVAGP